MNKRETFEQMIDKECIRCMNNLGLDYNLYEFRPNAVETVRELLTEQLNDVLSNDQSSDRDIIMATANITLFNENYPKPRARLIYD
jgi:hypothetical protein